MGPQRVAVALVVGLGAVPASGAPSPDVPPGLEGAVQLPDDAGAYAAVKLVDVGDGFALVDLLSGVFPDLFLTLSGIRDRLGLYALTRDEFVQNGIDPETPALVAFGVVDAEDWDRRPARASGSAGRKPAETAPVFARHRLVVKATDAAKLRGYLGAMLAGQDAVVASPTRGKRDPPWPTWFWYIRPLLGPLTVELVATTTEGGFLAFRTAGRYAVIDYAQPVRGRLGDPKRELPALLRKLVTPPRRSFSALLGQGSRKLLAEGASFALVLQPGLLGRLIPDATCRREWAGASGALVEDAAVAASFHPFNWRAHLGFGLTPLGRSRLDGTPLDDGLLDPRTAVADAVATVGFLVGGLDALRAAPRPAALAGSLEGAMARLRACGAVAQVVTAARFWPQLFGSAVEDTVPDRGARRLLSAVRNLVLVVRHPPERMAGFSVPVHALVLTSFPAVVGAELTSFLELQSSSRPERGGAADRPVTFYDLGSRAGFHEAGLERLAGGIHRLALAPRGGGLGWYYRMKPALARRGPQSTIGFLHLNVGRLLAMHAESADPATKKAIRLASTQLGILGGPITLDGDLLRLELGLGPP